MISKIGDWRKELVHQVLPSDSISPVPNEFIPKAKERAYATAPPVNSKIQMQNEAHQCQWQHMRRPTAHHNKEFTTVSATCQTIINSRNKKLINKDSCRRHMLQRPIFMHPSLMPTPKSGDLWIVDTTGPSTNWKLQSTTVNTHKLHSQKTFNVLKKTHRIKPRKVFRNCTVAEKSASSDAS